MKKKSRDAILLAGVPENEPDLEYATGFRAPDPVVFLQRGRSRTLVVSGLEQGRAEQAVCNTDVLTPHTLGIDRRKRGRLSEWALALARREGVRKVNVPGMFPHGVAKRLERAGIRVRIVEGAIFPERSVKSQEEQRKIRESQQAAVIAMRGAVAALGKADIDAKGGLRVAGKALTSEILRRLIMELLLRHDCQCREVIVACGTQSADPHQVGTGPLVAHEPVVIDIFPQHMDHGYWGDLTRTVARGQVPATLRKMYAGVKAAQAAALNRVKAGVKCSTVHSAAVREFRERGYKTEVTESGSEGFIHGTGHGVGLAIHEGPSVGPNDARLRAGNVITVEPGLYYPDIGGVRIEDTVVVTAGGWRYLVPCEKKLEI